MPLHRVTVPTPTFPDALSAMRFAVAVADVLAAHAPGSGVPTMTTEPDPVPAMPPTHAGPVPPVAPHRPPV